MAGDLLVGLSFGWWVDKHNSHHSHPNHQGRDPDIGDGMLAFTNDQVANRGGARALRNESCALTVTIDASPTPRPACSARTPRHFGTCAR